MNILTHIDFSNSKQFQSSLITEYSIEIISIFKGHQIIPNYSLELIKRSPLHRETGMSGQNLIGELEHSSKKWLTQPLFGAFGYCYAIYTIYPKSYNCIYRHFYPYVNTSKQSKHETPKTSPFSKIMQMNYLR